MKKRLIYYGIAILLASAVSLLLHIYVLNTIPMIVGQIMQNGEYDLLQPPYPAYVLITSWGSLIFMGGALLFLANFVYDTIGKQRFVLTSLFCSMIALAIQGELIRQPLMNFLVGNPIKVVILMAAKVWLSYIAMSLILSASLKYWRRTTEN